MITNGLEIGVFTFGEIEAAAFRREVVTGKLLLNLEKHDLNVLGIDHFAKRNALYDHIQSLKANMFRDEMASGKLIARMKQEQLSVRQLTTDQIQRRNVLLDHIGSLHNEQTHSSHSLPLLEQPTLNGFHGLSPIDTYVPSKSMPALNLSAFSAPPTPQIPNLSMFPEMEDLLRTQPVFNDVELDITKPPTKPLSVRNFKNGVIHSPQRTIVHAECKQLNFTEMQIVPDNDHLVDFPAIYQGANLHSRVFVLMTRRHIDELNALYSEFNVDRPRRSMATPLHDFGCDLEAEKVPHGWRLGTGTNAVKLPFNALVRCRLDLSSDEVVVYYWWISVPLWHQGLWAM